MADIPGLIEGASRGVGLGHAFLRHVQRSRLLLHVLDGSRTDLVRGLRTVNGELQEFAEALASKPQLVVVNKVDLPEVAARRDEVSGALSAAGVGQVCFISALTGEGLREVLQLVVQELARVPARLAAATGEGAPAVLRPRLHRRQVVEKRDGVYVLHSRRAAELAEMLGVESEEARQWFLRELKRMGLGAALRRAGVRPGERVRAGAVEVEWEG